MELLRRNLGPPSRTIRDAPKPFPIASSHGATVRGLTLKGNIMANPHRLIAAEAEARRLLDAAVENLAAARRDVPLFSAIPEEYYDALDAARAAWHTAYDALDAAQ
jgi:hypothetical protein